jgi:hypothetical protein
MNDCDPELFEAELRKLTPAQPPAELMARLAAARPAPAQAPADRRAALRSPAPAAQPRSLFSPVGRRSPAAPGFSQPSTLNPQPFWPLLLRWLAPAAAVAALAVTLRVWLPSRHANRQPGNQLSVAAQPTIKADAVEIDQQLVAAFDAVARLPGGQPIRFRCREWSDEVVLRDSARGIVIEQRMPRLEVVPVSFETY